MDEPMKNTRSLLFLLKIDPLVDEISDGRRICTEYEYYDSYFVSILPVYIRNR
jgi:hypothetical protein